MYETQLRKISENRIIKLIIMKDNQLNKTEEQRITIAFGIIATTIALLAFIDSGFWSFFKGLFSISGISAFIYILLTGTILKYKDEKSFGFMEVPSRIREMFYDLSIDIYGSNLILVLTYIAYYFISGRNSSSPDNIGIKYYFVGAGIALLLLVLFIFVEKRQNRRE